MALPFHIVAYLLPHLTMIIKRAKQGRAAEASGLGQPAGILVPTGLPDVTFFLGADKSPSTNISQSRPGFGSRTITVPEGNTRFHSCLTY